MEQLPKETLSQILSYCEDEDIGKFSLLCKNLKKQENIWSQLVQDRYKTETYNTLYIYEEWNQWEFNIVLGPYNDNLDFDVVLNEKIILKQGDTWEEVYKFGLFVSSKQSFYLDIESFEKFSKFDKVSIIKDLRMNNAYHYICYMNYILDLIRNGERKLFRDDIIDIVLRENDIDDFKKYGYIIFNKSHP